MLTRTRWRRWAGAGVAGLLLAQGVQATAQEKPEQVDKNAQADAAESHIKLYYDNAYKAMMGYDSSIQVISLAGTMGVTGTAVDETLRSHLGVPKDEGVVVVEVSADSPAARGGVQARDVLLKLDAKPITSVDNLDKLYSEGGSSELELDLVRAGKPLSVQLPPRLTAKIALLAFEAAEGELWIGVSVVPADETLRSQLNLPEGQGLIVTELKPECPAEKAGVKRNDVLLSLASRPLDSSEALVQQIQAVGEKAVELRLVRGGKPLNVVISAVKRPPQQRVANVAELAVDTLTLQAASAELAKRDPRSAALLLNEVGGGIFELVHKPVLLSDKGFVDVTLGLQSQAAQAGAPAAEPLEKKLDAVMAELKALRAAVDELKKASK